MNRRGTLELYIMSRIPEYPAPQCMNMMFRQLSRQVYLDLGP